MSGISRYGFPCECDECAGAGEVCECDECDCEQCDCEAECGCEDAA